MKKISQVKEIVNNLIQKKLTIAVAESCTGGYVCHMITNVPGSSKTFDRGIISYSNEAKIELLNVDPDSIQENGAVSEPVAYQMAKNVRELSSVDIGVGITGIAGPTGGTPEKPIGLVYIGYSDPKGTLVKKFTFDADRITFKQEVLGKVMLLIDELGSSTT